MLICCMETCEFDNIITNDLKVMCWLCDQYAHIKCAGLSDRVLELIESKSGLKWTCKDCRVIKSQMGRFMRQTRMEINELFSEFRLVYDRFSKLETAIESRQMSSTDSAIDSLDSQEIASSVNVNAELEPETINTYSGYTHSDSVMEIAADPATFTVPSVKNNSPNHPFVELPTIHIPRVLTAVPPTKAVFVSRFVPSTTEDALKYYIVSKLYHPHLDDIQVTKLYNKQKRKMASFRIVVPDSIFLAIINPKFWPEHIVVHEFVNKNLLNCKPFDVNRDLAFKNPPYYYAGSFDDSHKFVYS
ncbi:uncharacterized protein LOC108098545 [Drosophila ficusphila]|uniref:uncharacterized protein LOC108098545 n=1 Tax=Drosophila ficusphila TaxID=30025 RepID=UPI0007E7337F|nr:uncharacterized protein LOC108098545 [Drosophila ficusphila]